MKKTTEPQISPNRFTPLMELDTIKKGTKLYKVNDQTEVHWQYTVYTLLGDHPDGLICKDADGKTVLIENWELDKCFVYKGHA